jgi:hypothetical protein
MPKVPTGEIDLLAIGITDFVPFGELPTGEENSQQPVGTRREWRINAKTGDLRGVSIRERNKDRHPVGWLDKESKGWPAILTEYEAWRRKPRYAVGTLEQPAGNHAKQPTGANHGNVPE